MFNIIRRTFLRHLYKAEIICKTILNKVGSSPLGSYLGYVSSYIRPLLWIRNAPLSWPILVQGIVRSLLVLNLANTADAATLCTCEPAHCHVIGAIILANKYSGLTRIIPFRSIKYEFLKYLDHFISIIDTTYDTVLNNC